MSASGVRLLALHCASEGCSGGPSRSSSQEDEPVDHSKEFFIGIDVARTHNAVAIADSNRGGEIRYLGEVNASEENMRRLVKRIAAKH
jgi:hypothetical protein